MGTTFSQYLQARRRISYSTQRALAEEMSRRGMPTTVSAISQWEAGERMPRGDRLAVLLDVLAVDDEARTYALRLAAGIRL